MIKKYWYSHSWSEFEVQSLAYTILRKALYPKFLIRGEFKFSKNYCSQSRGCRVDIAIFTPWIEQAPPKLLLVIEVKKGIKSRSETQGKRYSDLLGVPYLYIRGKTDAFNILELIQPYISNI